MVGILRTKGTKIVDENGNHIILKGAATGGHLNMENFITGYPGRETEHKEALLKVLGRDKFDFFFDKFYEYFWTDEDAKFFSSLGLNCLRVPFNYKHFIDDHEPTKIKPQGFKLLDAVVNSCAKYGIYTILDLHTVPGGQNQGWHCDSGIHKALFWEFAQFQDTILYLWKELANHYKDNEWVAGYNPLNEPADSKGIRLTDFYTKVEKAIRSVDPDHILFLDGNTYSVDFDDFPEKPYPNSVYSIHDYSLFGFPGRVGTYIGSKEQKDKLKTQYEGKIQLMKKLDIPTWNGEFGPVYASHVRGDKDVEETNKARYAVLRDQLAIYKSGNPSGDETPISWSIWLYKDIGYQGLTFVNPETKWFKVLGPWLKKKQALGLDKWGRDADPEVNKIYEPVADHFKSVVPEKFHTVLYPHKYSSSTYIDLVVRDMLLSQYLTYEFAEYFRDMSYEELDEMAASFKLENCLKRDLLNRYLSEY